MADAASLIREGVLLERTIPLCLRPDLVRTYEQLQEKIAQLTELHAAADSMLGAPDTSELEAQKAALEAEMREKTIPFVFRALPRPRFRALWAKHPPRQGEDGKPVKEDFMGINSSTFFVELIREATVSPDLDEETWSILMEEKLSDRQFYDLANTCMDLSQERVDLPFTFTA